MIGSAGFALRFHWKVSKTESVDAVQCLQAGVCDSIVLPVDFKEADPMERLLRTSQEMRPRRIAGEIECGHVPHEQLLKFLGEWRRPPAQEMPEMFVSGDSAEAAELGIRYGCPVFLRPCGEQDARAQAVPLRHFGADVGFRAFLIARPSREDAIEAVRRLRAAFGNVRPSGVEERPSPEIVQAPGFWTGWNPLADAPQISMFGSFEDVAQAIVRYRKCGITRFLFMGWPASEEMEYFRKGVLPLLET